jgi:hypothetical protein
MEGTFKIGKLDAARRQLDTALLLYFNHVDPVSLLSKIENLRSAQSVTFLQNLA